jgi:hypothetical protein
MLKNDSESFLVRVESARFIRGGGRVRILLGYASVVLASLLAGGLGPEVFIDLGKHALQNSTHDTTAVPSAEHDDGPTYASVLRFSIAPNIWNQLFKVHLRMLHPGQAPGKDIGPNVAPHTWAPGKDISFRQTWTICGSDDNNEGGEEGADDGEAETTPAAVPFEAIDLSDGCASEGLEEWGSVTHTSKVNCRGGRRWCDPVVMWSVDHIRPGREYKFVAEVEWDWYKNHGPSATAHSIFSPQRDQELPFAVSLWTMNEEYTRFELAWKCIFVAVTLMISGQYFGACYARFRASHSSLRGLAHQHYWIGCMLSSLLLFNEPLFAARVFASDRGATNFLEKWHIWCSCFFLCFMLLYWLVLLDDCRVTSTAETAAGGGGGGTQSSSSSETTSMEGSAESEEDSNRFQEVEFEAEEALYLSSGISSRVGLKPLAWFYGPKVALVGTLWCLLSVSYLLFAARREADPSYELVDSSTAESDFKAVAVCVMVVASLYILWTGGLWCNVAADIFHGSGGMYGDGFFDDPLLYVSGAPSSSASSSPSSTSSGSVSEPFRWLFCLSSVSLLATVIGVFIGVGYGVPATAFVFIGFYGLLNAYVWTLAISWTPVVDDRNQLLQAAAETELSSLGLGAFSSSMSSSSSEGASEVYRDHPAHEAGYGNDNGKSTAPASPSPLVARNAGGESGGDDNENRIDML